MGVLANFGQLKFSQIRTQYKTSSEQSGTISMSDYYRGKDVDSLGTIVPNAGITSNIPTSGSIQMSDFRGTGHNFGNGTTLATLTNHARGYVLSNGTRSPGDKIRNYCIVYAGSQNVPSGCFSTNGIYNLSSGDKYAYATMTSGDRNATRRLGNSNSSVSSRGYNSGRTVAEMDNATIAECHSGVNPSSGVNSGYGRIGSFTHTNGTVNSGSGSSAGTLIMKHTENVSDSGKGNIVCYVFDYRFMRKLYDDLSTLGTLRNTL